MVSLTQWSRHGLVYEAKGAPIEVADGLDVVGLMHAPG